jgi:hypothetical protein
MSKTNNIDYKLAIAFGNWIAENELEGDRLIEDNTLGFSKSYLEDGSYSDFKTTKELFDEFLKEYND